MLKPQQFQQRQKCFKITQRFGWKKLYQFSKEYVSHEMKVPSQNGWSRCAETLSSVKELTCK